MSVANIAPITISSWSGFNTGSGGTGGTDYTINNNWGMSAGTTMIQSSLRVNGNAEFDGDIRIKGRSIVESIDKINERLAILVPNEQLEQEWSELAELRMRYVEMERQLLEKQRVFDILKKCD